MRIPRVFHAIESFDSMHLLTRSIKAITILLIRVNDFMRIVARIVLLFLVQVMNPSSLSLWSRIGRANLRLCFTITSGCFRGRLLQWHRCRNQTGCQLVACLSRTAEIITGYQLLCMNSSQTCRGHGYQRCHYPSTHNRPPCTSGLSP